MSQVVCPRCGSLQTRVVGGGLLQRCVAVLRRQAVISCVRCGWQGRQRRLDAVAPRHQAPRKESSDRKTVDLAALDQALGGDAATSAGGRSR